VPLIEGYLAVLQNFNAKIFIGSEIAITHGPNYMVPEAVEFSLGSYPTAAPDSPTQSRLAKLSYAPGGLAFPSLDHFDLRIRNSAFPLSGHRFASYPAFSDFFFASSVLFPLLPPSPMLHSYFSHLGRTETQAVPPPPPPPSYLLQFRNTTRPSTYTQASLSQRPPPSSLDPHHFIVPQQMSLA